MNFIESDKDYTMGLYIEKISNFVTKSHLIISHYFVCLFVYTDLFVLLSIFSCLNFLSIFKGVFLECHIQAGADLDTLQHL